MAALHYICGVANSFSKQVVYERTVLLATVVPQLRRDGMCYEVNIRGFPRFYMKWSELGRYDIAGEAEEVLPYGLLLAVSDMLEKTVRR